MSSSNSNHDAHLMFQQLIHPLTARALAGLAMNAHAHRGWMVPSSTMVESKDAWVTVDAAVSDGLFEIDHQPLRLDALQVTGPDGAQVTPANTLTGRLRNASDIEARSLAPSNSARVPSFLTTDGSAISARS